MDTNLQDLILAILAAIGSYFGGYRIGKSRSRKYDDR